MIFRQSYISYLPLISGTATIGLISNMYYDKTLYSVEICNYHLPQREKVMYVCNYTLVLNDNIFNMKSMAFRLLMTLIYKPKIYHIIYR